jgi:hypothetical protein
MPVRNFEILFTENNINKNCETFRDNQNNSKNYVYKSKTIEALKSSEVGA